MTREAAAPRPMTVIGGFLGAGKTTLLNHLLTTARGRIAVLVNDFGAINVDAGLILVHEGETLRLTNGCVCCSIADDFAATLIGVLDAPEPFDHIVIEASGVGDPSAIAEIALVEPQLVLNAVVVVADAERLGALLDDPRLGDTLARQVAGADLVLLNKVDLVDAAGQAAAAARLRALRPGLRIVPTVGARVPDDLLAVTAPGPGSIHAAAPSPGGAADHEALFHRVLYRRRGAFDRDRLAAALAGLPPGVLRLKGLCVVARDTVLLQLVGQRWSLASPPAGTALAADVPIEHISTELVGIATDAATAAAVVAALDAALTADMTMAQLSHGMSRAPPRRVPCPSDAED